jgi:hypothetical protein
MEVPPFPDQWLTPFRASPFSLRFELGGETFGNNAPVPRFIQAFGRARDVTRDVFSASQQLFGIVALPVGPERDFYAPESDGFANLAEAGLACQHFSEWTAPLWPDQEAEEDQVSSLWRAFDLSADRAAQDVLLWCAVSYEMAITPKAPVVSFLADLDRSILLHVYDDRGMDVTALERQRLLPTYQGRNEWLLDYDRPRMEQVFGTPS